MIVTLIFLVIYTLYSCCILTQDVLSVVNEFQLFLSGNLDVLSTNPSLSDVVQLALTTLHSDSLVKQARRETEKDNDTMYLIWKYVTFDTTMDTLYI